MTGPRFVNWLFLGDSPDGVPHPQNSKLRAFFSSTSGVCRKTAGSKIETHPRVPVAVF
jgi:hypothetical protein